MSYRLIKSEKLQTGRVRQLVLTEAGEERFVYFAIRFALVWPTPTSPGYFLGGGEETWDEQIYSPASGRGLLRITVGYEQTDLSLDALFARLTDEMSAHLGETCYCDLKNLDYRTALYDYLDRKRLRNISIEQAPYDDFLLRVGIVKTFDESGDLVIDKGSPLYTELQGISRVDVAGADVTSRFFRLNALSYLVSGFQKFTPVRSPMLQEFHSRHRESSWMIY